MSNNLRVIRKKMGMQQKELAGLLGCTAGNVSHYEAMGQTIPRKMAEKIVQVAASRGLTITIDDIYEGDKFGSLYTEKDELHLNAQILSDAFGGKCIVVDGRVFITINFMPTHINKVGMGDLAQKILKLVTGEPE